jgi:hypothetical protein
MNPPVSENVCGWLIECSAVVAFLPPFRVEVFDLVLLRPPESVDVEPAVPRAIPDHFPPFTLDLTTEVFGEPDHLPAVLLELDVDDVTGVSGIWKLLTVDMPYHMTQRVIF